MTKRKSILPISRSQSQQLSFGFDSIDPDPLPLLVAKKWQFALQHHIIDNQHWYSPIDWLAGLIGRNTASHTWRNIKFNTTDQGVYKLDTLPYTAPDGKTYMMDFVTDKGLYWITQKLRLRENRPALKEIREYLANAGVLVDEIRRDPGKAADIAIAGYLNRGKSPEWIKDRLNAVTDFKLLCDAITQVCQRPNYGAVVNTEYLGLFGEMADQLKAVLHTKSIRDALPELQLSYLHTAEIGLRQLLARQDQMTNEQICEAARIICDPLGESLKQISMSLGVHHITGQPLLKDGQQ